MATTLPGGRALTAVTVGVPAGTLSTASGGTDTSAGTTTHPAAQTAGIGRTRGVAHVIHAAT